MAQASCGTPVREARHDTRASKRSPLKPSCASEAGSWTSPTRTVAPASSRALSSGASLPPTPARGRTKHTTSWPRCTQRAHRGAADGAGGAEDEDALAHQARQSTIGLRPFRSTKAASPA